MDIAISTTALRTALHRVQGIVEAKSTMPILSCVQLDAEITPDGGRLTVKATDLEIGAITSHACEVKKAGTLAVPAKVLKDLANSLPDATCRLKVSGNNRLEVTSGASSFRVAGLDAADFPTIAEAKGLKYAPVDRIALREGLDRVAHAMSDDQTRYNLNGILFDYAEGKLTLVATDGHRLALTELPGDGTGNRIVSRKAVGELGKILSEDTGSPGELACNDNCIAYRREGLIFTARLIDGQFPAYTQVLPEVTGSVATVQRSGMLDALKRVMLLSTKGDAVQMDVAEDKMTLTVRNPDLGEATDSVPVEYKGKQITISLNGFYIRDVLSSTTCPAVTMQLDDDQSPVMCKPIDGSLTAILMPMRR